jgi:hypothetical protein
MTHAPWRSSDVSVVLDSSALARACAPAAPELFPVTARSQHGVPITREAEITNTQVPRKRTAKIQCRQGSVGLERLGQRLCARSANLTACSRSQSAESPDNPITHKSNAKRTAENQRRQRAVGLQRLCQCPCGRNANLVVCNRTHSARFSEHHHRSRNTHHHTLASTTVHSGKRTSENQCHQSGVRFERLSQCPYASSANLVACTRPRSARRPTTVTT